MARTSFSGNLRANRKRVLNDLISSRCCGSVVYRERTESTNSDAIADVQSGVICKDELPRLYLADHQTAGRGRHGNRWISDVESLTFSMLLEIASYHQQSIRLMSIAAGIAVAQAIDFLCAPSKASLKWPNDVYLGGGKVAGILIEICQHKSATNATTMLVVGIGVNTNAAPAASQFADSDASQVQSLSGVTHRVVDDCELLVAIIEQLHIQVENVIENPNELLSSFRRRCMLSGKSVSFVEQGKSLAGLCKGISDSGSLIVQTGSGTHYCDSGEVRRVRS